MGAFLCAILHGTYREFRRDGLPIAAVRYEDLIKDPETCMRRVLLFSGLTNRGVRLTAADCQRVLSNDSQKNTPLESSVLARHPTLHYAGFARTETDECYDNNGLPRLSENAFIADGTISANDDAAEAENIRAAKLIGDAVAKPGPLRNRLGKLPRTDDLKPKQQEEQCNDADESRASA